MCNAFIACEIYQFYPETILLETYPPSALSEDSGAGNKDGISIKPDNKVNITHICSFVV